MQSRNTLNFMLVMSIELCYGIIAMLLSDPFVILEKFAGPELNNMVWDQARMLTVDGALDTNIALTGIFIAKFIVLLLAFFFVHALLYAAFTYAAWTRIAGKKATYQSAMSFISHNTLWVFLWMLVFVLIASVIEPFAIVYWMLFCGVAFAYSTTMLDITLIDTATLNFRQAVRKLQLYQRLNQCKQVLLTSTLGSVIAVGLLVVLGYVAPFTDTYFEELFVLLLVAVMTWWRMTAYAQCKLKDTKHL